MVFVVSCHYAIFDEIYCNHICKCAALALSTRRCAGPSVPHTLYYDRLRVQTEKPHKSASVKKENSERKEI